MSEAGDGTVELLAPVLCGCRSLRPAAGSIRHSTTWSAMLHGEPAWLFGAVHSPAEIRLGLIRAKTPPAWFRRRGCLPKDQAPAWGEVW